MKGSNSKELDTVIEKLLDEFIKADKVRQDPELLNLVLKTVKHFAEIQDFKGMYKKYIIPKVNKYLVDLNKIVNGSTFKSLITNEFVDLEENKNEIIRLGIVGLFHKYESYRKDLVRNFNEYLRHKDIKYDMEAYLKESYGFKLSDNWNNNALFEVSWICNRIKHDSSLPISFEKPNQPIPKRFSTMNKEEKLVLKTNELYEYYDLIYQYCHDLFQLFNHVYLKLQMIELGAEAILSRKLNEEIKQKIVALNNRITDHNIN